MNYEINYPNTKMVLFEELNIGDFFLFGECLYLKYSEKKSWDNSFSFDDATTLQFDELDNVLKVFVKMDVSYEIS